jgi:hypothetical protein
MCLELHVVFEGLLTIFIENLTENNTSATVIPDRQEFTGRVEGQSREDVALENLGAVSLAKTRHAAQVQTLRDNFSLWRDRIVYFRFADDRSKGSFCLPVDDLCHCIFNLFVGIRCFLDADRCTFDKGLVDQAWQLPRWGFHSGIFLFLEEDSDKVCLIVMASSVLG